MSHSLVLHNILSSIYSCMIHHIEELRFCVERIRCHPNGHTENNKTDQR